MKKRIALLLCAFLTVTIMTGCSKKPDSETKEPEATESAEKVQSNVTEDSQKEEKVKITIGISAFQDTLLPIIGQEKGWYEEAGLDVEFETLAWNAIMPAMASNSIDVAVYNTTGVIAAYAQMPDTVFLYPWNIFAEGQALMGRGDGKTKTVEDFEKEGMEHAAAVKASVEQLRGKEIITTLGTDMGKAVEAVCKNNGLTPKDYTIIDMDTDQGLAAFISGSGDFYLGGIPQRTRLEAEGYIAVAVGADLCPVPINGWVTSNAFYEKNEEALLKLQQVMFRIVRYTRYNMEEVGTIITDKLNASTGSEMTLEQFELYFNKIEDYTGSAAETQEKLLGESGYAYWKKTWDDDNNYYLEEQSGVEAVPYTAFMAEDFQKKYVEKYGSDESGY